MNDRGRAIVVGGSFAGLTAALLLREQGFEVDIFERTGDYLDGRGGGIVLQPDTVRWIQERPHPFTVEDVSIGSTVMRYLGEDNKIAYEEAAAWRFSSWTTMYRVLFDDFGPEHYHLGEFAVGLDQDDDGVTLRFVSGRTERASLVVFADGVSSVGRRRLQPRVMPRYAGYIGWRGCVPEDAVTAETADLINDALAYSVIDSSHICMYAIPGADGSLSRGKRQLNYIWYRNVAEGPALDEMTTDLRGFTAPVSVHPGQVQRRFVDQMRTEAASLLPPAAAELIARTPEPYIQIVLDIAVRNMAFGRVALIGDAAFAARPHAAAGTAKAAADAWSLAAALAAEPDIPRALAAWEPSRLELGNDLLSRVAEMGARSQFTNTWDPADPALHFGLYGPDR
ncbi:FAD binding domain-containing protein [Paractinoplanes lichenicola]|uniref:FAD-dependent monooxygenase n=1 Tax=Paractinoplanes lichenicola TaxID=2802976 RepID=A0ABS1VVM9_9ACTN|nr:FAD-dependent monooxygenase [Actinoplanes lichenicola]MBL7258533.1 FAD-dependent monooxygenase [Actinoplanes lichenicola]